MSETLTVNKNLEQLAVDTIKFLSVDAVEKANSGHPGLPTGAMDYAFVIWNKFLRFQPKDPRWPNRDRFVLSAGHGSMLLYSLLHLTGYDVSLDDLKSFRQWGSNTPGHPEFHLTPGVEATTGPLGQGFANGVGMGLAAKMLAARFNKPGFELFNYHIYVICSDGDLEEGISHEAASFAGHNGLGNLIYVYDDNHISIGGNTNISYSDDVQSRFEGYHWHVQKIDGHDRAAAEEALRNAVAVTDKPSLIIARTHIAKDAPTKHDTSAAHGEPLGDEEIAKMKEALHWPEEPAFYVPDGVYDVFRARPQQVEQEHKEWQALLARYKAEFPEMGQHYDAMHERFVPGDIEDILLDEALAMGPDATRGYGGKLMNVAAQYVPSLVGGSADLEPSTKTLLKDGGSIEKDDFAGRNIHFGIREHGMGGIVNGMAYGDFFIPYGATFFCFLDYMRGSVRLSALSELQSIWIFTHDSIFLGEDGPTHQPVEHFAIARATPHLMDIRPADAAETAIAWAVALEHKHTPAALILSRQKAPGLQYRDARDAKGLKRGAYILQDAPDGKPDVVVIASGTEVYPAQEALKLLEGVKARLVSMPSWYLFEQQDQAYRDSVIPPDAHKRVAVEAAASLGWERWVGIDGLKLCVDRFGASAPLKELQEHFGYTPEKIAASIREYLGQGACGL